MKRLPLVTDQIPVWERRLEHEPEKVLREVVIESEALMQEIDQLELADPTNGGLDLHSQVGRFVTALVSRFPDVAFVARLVWRASQITSRHQARVGKPVHRGRDLYNAGLLLYLQGDVRQGVRLIMLSLIEDIYFWKDPRQVKSSEAYQFLVSTGYTERIVSILSEKIRRYWDTGIELWHPEDVLDLDPDATSLLLSRNSDVGLSLVHLRAKADLVSRETDRTKKGALLEELAHSLLSQVDGVRVLRRHGRTKTSDIDVFCRIESNRLLEFLFGPYILVECKNWEETVDPKVIREFAYKLLSARVTGGILLTKKGSLGKGAHAELDSLFDRHGLVVVVLTLEDIRNMKSPMEVAEGLATRAERVRFGLLTSW